MRKTIEVGGFIAPLLLGCLFAVAGLVAPFGSAADKGGTSILLSATLFVASAAVALHLLRRGRVTSLIGILAGSIAIGLETYLYYGAQLLGSPGYWQTVSATVLCIAACGLHLRKIEAREGQF